MSGAHCLFDGALVGTQFPVPDDAGDFYADAKRLVGCNRLACPDCGAAVRHFDGYRLSREPDGRAGEIALLYETTDPSAQALLTRSMSGADFRVYVCRCNYEQTAAVRKLAQGDVAVNWACAGHPAA